MPLFMRWRVLCSSVSAASLNRFARLQIVSRSFLNVLMMPGPMSSLKVYDLAAPLDPSAFCRRKSGTIALPNCACGLNPSFRIPALCHSVLPATGRFISIPGPQFSRTNVLFIHT